MNQQLVNLDGVFGQQAAPDTAMNISFVALTKGLRTIKVTISTQGNTGTPSKVDFQLQDSKGVNITNEQYHLRVRVSSNANGYPVNAAASKTFVVDVGTLVSGTPGGGPYKDAIIASAYPGISNPGLIRLTLTNNAAGTIYLVTGYAEIFPLFGNCNQSIGVTH